MNSKISSQTPGQMLKAAREAKNISIVDVSQRLLLSKQIITAIEADDYSKIYAKVYAEGYLKAYANFLQLPVDQIIEGFRSLNIYSESEVESNVKSGTTCSVNFPCVFEDKRIRLGLIIGMVVLALVISSVFITKANKKNQAITPVETAANASGDLNYQAEQSFDSGKTSLVDMKKPPVKKHEPKSANSLEFDVPVSVDGAQEENR